MVEQKETDKQNQRLNNGTDKINNLAPSESIRQTPNTFYKS